MRLDFFVRAQFITRILKYIQKVHRTYGEKQMFVFEKYKMLQYTDIKRT